MAKKAPKEYKPGQRVIVKLSNGMLKDVIDPRLFNAADGMKLQVDFGHDETALIELLQVLED